MNARERLLAALEGKPVDRVPVWLLFPYHPIGCYADVRTTPCYQPIFEESRRHAVMLNRRHLSRSLFAPEVREGKRTFDDAGWTVQERTLSCGGRQLVSETRRRGDQIRIKPYLCTDEDLDTLLSFPLSGEGEAAVSGGLVAELDGQMPRYLTERREFPAEYGAMMLDLGEPIGFLYHNADLEQYALWSITRSDDIVAWLDRAMKVYRRTYEYCLERDLAEVYFMVGSELASPPLVSRATFQRWIVPYARELIAMIHARGRKVIQHYHGKIKLILPDFLTMAPDALHTIEAPPIGDTTLTDAYRVLGDRITLIGNIQYDEFRALTAPRMAQAVRDVLAEARGRRFILSPTAGPYEPTISPEMVENYLTFMRTAAEWRG